MQEGDVLEQNPIDWKIEALLGACGAIFLFLRDTSLLNNYFTREELCCLRAVVLLCGLLPQFRVLVLLRNIASKYACLKLIHF